MVEIVTDQCLKTDVFVSKYCILMGKCRLRMYPYIQDKSIGSNIQFSPYSYIHNVYMLVRTGAKKVGQVNCCCGHLNSAVIYRVLNAIVFTTQKLRQNKEQRKKKEKKMQKQIVKKT